MARILVAEDDASANKLISAVLRRDNHEVLSAVDGQDALDVLDHEHVDLIVSDVMMPRVDGHAHPHADGAPGCRDAAWRVHRRR